MTHPAEFDAYICFTYKAANYHGECLVKLLDSTHGQHIISPGVAFEVKHGETLRGGSVVPRTVDETMFWVVEANGFDYDNHNEWDSGDLPKPFARSGHQPEGMCNSCGRPLSFDYQCDICGGWHDENRHEVVVQLDTGRMNIETLLVTQVRELLQVLKVKGYADGRMADWEQYTKEPTDDMGVEPGDWHEAIISVVDYELEPVVNDCGFYVDTNADSGTWTIYKEVEEGPELMDMERDDKLAWLKEQM